MMLSPATIEATQRNACKMNNKISNLTGRSSFLIAVTAMTTCCLAAGQASAPKAASGKMSFEVASVRQNKTDDKASMNVDPTSGAGFIPTGGLYSARNIVLISYISFAYKLTNRQLQSVVSQVPWVAEDRFDIDARADGKPDERRLSPDDAGFAGRSFQAGSSF
jgi:hypothetical protein